MGFFVLHFILSRPLPAVDITQFDILFCITAVQN